MKNKKNDKKKLLKAISLVNQIQKIRSQNNNNWMDLLKLSLKLDFKNSDYNNDDLLDFQEYRSATKKIKKRKAMVQKFKDPLCVIFLSFESSGNPEKS